ncbi:MAG: hypothetical protein LAO76_02715 [Acidobacteriia bacterium]|nr:hypothetical protein [Terriglobia bacterium]
MKGQKHAVALAAVGLILLGSFAGCGGSSGPSFVGKLTPDSVHAGSPTFTLTVTGDGFGSGSVVEMNANPLPTKFVASTTLTASVDASFAEVPQILQVSVVNPSSSNSSPFTVSTIVISSLSPSSAKAGGPAFTLTVVGSFFTSSSVVEFNGSALPTTFVDPNTVTAAVPASAIASAGTVPVDVANGPLFRTDPVGFTITP